MWENIKRKLSSRKFILAVVSGILVILNDGMDWGIPEETVRNFVVLILGYIFAEGAIDASRVFKNGEGNKEG